MKLEQKVKDLAGCRSTVELTDMQIATRIGTYGPEDVVPDAHILDITLEISPELVLIETDGMAHVFDYDPLIRTIDHLARDTHYATQERLMTRIVAACAEYDAVKAVTIRLRKTPVLGETGHLGVRLSVDESGLRSYRSLPG
ncbi:MAG: dihydroneopterin aldolase [Pseudomonadota bacterium]